jgi:hypothetical protein
MKRLRPISVFLLLLACAGPASQPAIVARTDALVKEWKDRLTEENLRYLVCPPFVIAGAGTRGRLVRYRDGTVLAAARALRATYFEKEPEQPVLILLFEDAKEYARLSKKWFDDEDVPHFGYYRHADHVMVMNVGTGTGTLVHELTHALIAPDFPGVPSWFNEGLASLYEQSSIQGDRIEGLVNWRLPHLQKAIRAGKLRPFPELMADPHFYRNDLVGLNYAQARYLMLYLQEQHLLRSYYREFRDHAREDPTGVKSLEAVIAPQTLDAFEKEWRAWTRRPRYP